jgi:hypothetical protein
LTRRCRMSPRLRPFVVDLSNDLDVANTRTAAEGGASR